MGSETEKGCQLVQSAPVSKLLLWKAGTHTLCRSPGGSMKYPSASFPLLREEAGVLIQQIPFRDDLEILLREPPPCHGYFKHCPST